MQTGTGICIAGSQRHPAAREWGGMAYLEIETREGTHRVNLERDQLSIGRLSYNDVVLPFAQISRQHAELRLINGQWWIADLHSTNGVQINSRRVQEQALTSGDQIVLAPGISIRFVDDVAQPARTGGESQAPLARSASRSDPFAPLVPSSSIAPLRPRSPFASDEVPFVPPGMQPSAASAPPSTPSHPIRAVSTPARRPRGRRSNSLATSRPNAPDATDGNGSSGGRAGNGSGGYPAPPGPLRSGADPSDPFLREGAKDEHRRATAGPSLTLLHVCQTCGQLTAPDSVYCQSCHHSIAHECSNCQLNLLPIQERCPRCHTPNRFSVRRTHPRRTSI